MWSRAEHKDPRAPNGTSAPVDDGIALFTPSPVDDGTTRFTRNKTVEWIDRIINDVENEALQGEAKEFMMAHPLYAEQPAMA